MNSRRTAKAAEAIRETVSSTVLFGLRDPRIQGVTVLSVEASPDLRTAKVHVSVMGSQKRQALTMKGLRAARGYLQAKLADRLQTRNTPVLEFVLDSGVKKSIEAARLLREAGLSPESESGPAGGEGMVSEASSNAGDVALEEDLDGDLDESDDEDWDEDEWDDEDLDLELSDESDSDGFEDESEASGGAAPDSAARTQESASAPADDPPGSASRRT